jgi:outer membrane protein OmpA-like peptidoglycan-associated protein
MRTSRTFAVVAVLIGLNFTHVAVGQPAHPYIGPFVPNPGMQITTTFTNDFGRDADSTTVIGRVTPTSVALQYWSTRGIAVSRNILVRDRDIATSYVLGYSPRMPTTIASTTSLGLSGAVLERLRSTGSAPLTLVYSEKLDRIACTLTAKAVDVKVPLIIEDRVADIPIVEADVACGRGNRTGTGRLTIVNDVNNPVVIDSSLKFSRERRARTERVTRVAAGPGLHSAMEQSLNTLGAYDVYGLHFDFDRATLRASTAQLVREIATMLKSNANWVIQIAGHTDSTGRTDYNLRLSSDRASAVRRALIKEGIAEQRLKAVGYGESQPKADNSTLAGRAINRRVEFRRLDR